MARLLYNLNDEQKSKIFWLRDQWRSHEKVTDIDRFEIATKLTEPLVTPNSAFTTVKHKVKPVSGTPNDRNKCGVPHKWPTPHTLDQCDDNPKNADQKAKRQAK